MSVVRRRRVQALGLAAASAILITGCAVSASDTVHLRVTSGFPHSHPLSYAGVETFLAELTEGDDAQFDAEYWPAGQMGSARDMVALTRSGALDITNVHAANQAEMFPLSTVGDLGGFTYSSCEGSAAFMELARPGGILYEEEYEPLGLRPLWAGSFTDYEVWTVGKEVRTPDDMRGITIRSGGGAMDAALSALGAAPVALPSSDVYESLQRRTIDAVAFPPNSIPLYGLEEIVRYGTVGAGFSNGILVFVMKISTWDTLTEDQQKLVLDAAEVARQTTCEQLDADNATANETTVAAGATLTELTDDEKAAFAEVLGPVQEKWAASLDARGLPATDVLHAFTEAVERHSTPKEGSN